MHKSIYKIFLLTSLIIFFVGCKTTRKATTAETPTEAQQLVLMVQSSEPKFNNIEFKRMSIGLNLNEKSRYNSIASCKIIPDSVIHISVQPFFGVEMFMARLTPNQILIIDKLKGVYYQSDYSIFEHQFGLAINYRAFESLFTNKLFSIVTDSKMEGTRQPVADEKTNKMLSYKNGSLDQHFYLNENYRIREMAVSSNSGNEQFIAYYSDFTQNGNILFPSDMRFQLKNRTELYSINMSISRLAVDETINIPELNLNQYRQGNILSLIK